MSSPPVSDLMPLAELSPALRPYTDPTDAGALRRIAYQPLWLKVCEGVIPAIKIGGRLFVQRSHVPEIARTLGLKATCLAKPTCADRAPSNSAVIAV